MGCMISDFHSQSGKGRNMIKKMSKINGSGTGKSAKQTRTGRYRYAFVLSAFLTVLIMGAGFGCLRAQADEKIAATVVVNTATEDEFAAESSKLAKQNAGLSIKSGGVAKPYSAARLIVCMKDGEKADLTKYNPVKIVKSDFGVSLVQFDSADEAKKAAEKIGDLSCVSYVEPDDCFMNIGDTVIDEVSSNETEDIPSGDTDDVGSVGDLKIGDKIYSDRDDLIYENSLETESITISSEAMSWGASYIQADKYAAFVKANTNKSIKVAVVDTGVSSHTRLSGRLLGGKDFIDNDNDASDKNGHGTHVAGIIVDCTPGINVKILPVRVMNASGEGSPSIVGNGIRYAANSGAKVINLSLGAYTHYQYIEQCITYAHNKGATVVVAAGNESDNTQFVCPAHMTSPIVVGAIDSEGKRAYFSNYGSTLDVVAPGVNIRSCWLNGKYASASGTSMAVPHISAAAAMYRLMNPSITPAKTEYMVRCYAKDLGAKGTDNYYGRGVPRMAGAITPSKVTMSQTTASLRVGKTLTLKATISPSYAGRNQLTWSTSNDGIVSVSGGKLTALHEGEAVITVKTVNGKKATCKVTVSNANGELLQIGPLMRTPIDKSIAGALSIVDNAVKKSSTDASRADSTAAPSKKNSTADGQTRSTASGQTSGASSPAQTVSTAASGQADAAKTPVPGTGTKGQESQKIYIYPSEKNGNTPVQDGSIVAGSRLALDAEVVPVQEGTALSWQSSAPAVASVDENGVVTAFSVGEAQITAALTSRDGQSSASGTYSIKVVNPSALTRHASYSAGDESEATIDVVLRLPASLSDDSAAGADRINPAADYVAAVLSKEGSDAVLLGAVNLGGADSGAVHVHESKGGRKRTDITKIRGASEEILTDLSSGKKASETGILYMRSISADGCKADLSLAADVEALRALTAAGETARTENLSDCRITVYTAAAFEKREEAVERNDREGVRKIDEEAVCSCSFTLSFDIPASDTEAAETAPAAENGNDAKASEEADQDGGDTDGRIDNSDEEAAEPDAGSEDNTPADQGETENDQAGQKDEEDDSSYTSEESGSDDASDAAQAEESDETGDASTAESSADEQAPADDAGGIDAQQSSPENDSAQETEQMRSETDS